MSEEVEAPTVRKPTGGIKVAVPKIYASMLSVAAGIGTIPKNGSMKFGATSYAYVKNDDILERISQLLVENNIIVKPTFTIQDIERGNRPFVYVNLTQTYVSALDGSEVSIAVVGQAAAGDDKSIRKATTQKMANLLTFSIATGEPDPDGIPTPEEKAGAARGPAAGKIDNARAKDASSKFNEIKAFLGANGLQGSVANVLGTRLSGGKAASEWTADVAVLDEVLKALKAGEVE